MNVEIGTEAVLFPEKEYIKGIFFAVHVNKVITFQYGKDVGMTALHPICHLSLNFRTFWVHCSTPDLLLTCKVGGMGLS